MRGLLLLLLAAPALAAGRTDEGRWRLRAREHLRAARVRPAADLPCTGRFGLASTIDLWYERPLRSALGLFFQFGGAAKDDPVPPGESGSTAIWQAGVEGLRFLRPGYGGPYGRAGVGLAWLRTKGPLGTRFGGGWYLGAGWEQLVGRVGIAPELAVRHLILEGGGWVLAFTPSIGFHFYVFGDDAESLSR